MKELTFNLSARDRLLYFNLNGVEIGCISAHDFPDEVAAELRKVADQVEKVENSAPDYVPPEHRSPD